MSADGEQVIAYYEECRPNEIPWAELTLKSQDRWAARWEQADQAEVRHPGFKVEYDAPDMVAHPPHYTSHPSGVECIQVTEHLNFCIGNAVKYLWRTDDKGDPLENLRKAAWYIDREIARREAES